MFILMQSVWNSGFIQKLIINMNVNITNLLMIFIVSIVLSQFISNVPLVALYLPMLLEAGASSKEIIALAASSTIAGNLFILGAASTVIIVQNAEKRSNETITFLEFARVGIPLTILNAAVYYVYLSFF
jgi:Na+/H+ antiporter NhaD/arsenite permease-like protein